MNNIFWDTHAHLYKEYCDVDSVINNATKNGVEYIINSGVDNDTNMEILEISSNKENVYCSLGIHPENVNKYKNEDIDFIEVNISNEKVLAIGEIGLDYHYDGYDKESQIILFEKQLKIAERMNMPVIIHSRDATKDTLDILRKYNVKGIIHSFSGSLETANEYIKMGFLLGVNGIVTFKNCKMKDVYSKIDITNIVFETDSPYLAPVPNRGKVNEPANVVHIAKFIAELYGIEISEVAKITNNNVSRIFDKLR